MFADRSSYQLACHERGQIKSTPMMFLIIYRRGYIEWIIILAIDGQNFREDRLNRFHIFIQFNEISTGFYFYVIDEILLTVLID